MTLTVILVYLGLVVTIGLSSHRLFRRTGEDYFVASRSIGSFVLLMSLFGTHMTSFALLGASAQAYRIGIGVFALMASFSALMAPVVFLFVGTRVWSLGKRHGFVTQGLGRQCRPKREHGEVHDRREDHRRPKPGTEVLLESVVGALTR